MAYSDKVLDHYENPKNVGTLDKEDDNVGTGLVGAPACLHGDTLVALADGREFATIRQLAEEGKDVPVYSYCPDKDRIVVKIATNIRKTRKNALIVRLIFDDGSFLICTPDHLIRTRVEGREWVEASKLLTVPGTPIMPFTKKVRRQDYEVDYGMSGQGYTHIYDGAPNVIAIESYGSADVYCMTVEGTANFAVLISTPADRQNGIIVHNCGDVMRLQLKINPETEVIEDAKFKTFGCVASNTPVLTASGYVPVSDIEAGTVLNSWDGECIVGATVKEVVKRSVDIEDLLVVKFKSGKSLVVTKDHIFMTKYGTPVEAEDSLSCEIFGSSSVETVSSLLHPGVLHKELWDAETDPNSDTEYVMYDLKLSGPHVYFSGPVASHNCGSAIASSSLVTEWVKGRTIDEAENLENTQIVEELNLPPVKIHCSVLAEDAIKSAIADFRKKQKAKKEDE